MTDRNRIIELQALWAQLDVDKDAERWSRLFAEDGTYVGATGATFVGRPDIRRCLEERTATRPAGRAVVHLLSTPLIRIDADRQGAIAITDYVTFVRNSMVGPWVSTIGRLESRCVRRSGSWLLFEVRNHSWPSGRAVAEIVYAPPSPAAEPRALPTMKERRLPTLAELLGDFDATRS
jgi:uncharacterized protein (TIGR02246 family)